MPDEGLLVASPIETREVIPEPIPEQMAVLRPLFSEIIEDGLKRVVDGPLPNARVVIVGAGCAGLVAGRELKRAGFGVEILESSHRVGGRVVTFHDSFADGMHGEGGAMRLPRAHHLVRQYLDQFGLLSQLENFPQGYRLIYLSALMQLLSYDDFETMIRTGDPSILKLFPNLSPSEIGVTPDELWKRASTIVVDSLHAELNRCALLGLSHDQTVFNVYETLESNYGNLTLRGFLEQIALWSEDAIQLYDLANSHVVLSNSFTESWKDDFLSSQSSGTSAGLQQLSGGMDTFTRAFTNPGDPNGLSNEIRYGSTVFKVERLPVKGAARRVRIHFKTSDGRNATTDADGVIFAVPFTVLNMIQLNEPFSVAKMTAIRTLRYVEVTKILLQFKSRWWENALVQFGQSPDGGLVTDLPIRYASFPSATSKQLANTARGVVMASYTFERDATQLGCLSDQERCRIAVRDLATIFSSVGSEVEESFEVGASQVWPASDKSGGSAFTYWGPGEAQRLYKAMLQPEWDKTAFFAGEHISYHHGWIEGAVQSGLTAAYQFCT